MGCDIQFDLDCALDHKYSFPSDGYCGIIYSINMRQYQIVIDTNVLVAALRSRRGASYRLLRLVDGGGFTIHVSVPLVLEYEDVAKRLLER